MPKELIRLPIDKHVPIPPKRRPEVYRHPRYVCPWRDMAAKDSFFFPSDGVDIRRLQVHLTALASHYQPNKYTTRGEKNGVRVWRIS